VQFILLFKFNLNNLLITLFFVKINRKIRLTLVISSRNVNMKQTCLKPINVLRSQLDRSFRGL